MELNEVKGIGEAISQKLRSLGITSVYGLLTYLPSKYVNLKLPVSALDAEEGQFSLLEGEVTSVSAPSRRGTRSFFVTFLDLLSTKKTYFKANFYNQPYLSQVFTTGKRFRLLGKFAADSGELLLTNPIFEQNDRIKHLDGIYTVYPLKGEIGQKTFKNLLTSTFSMLASSVKTSDFERKLLDNLHTAHFPSDAEECKNAVENLAALDLAAGILTYQKLRSSAQKPRKLFYNLPFSRILDLKNAFSMVPTQSQDTAIKEILNDLNSNENMSRIISGDVGSGKSLVAYAAIYFAANSGYQAAYMAPTEILAVQQFEKFNKLADKLGIKTALLTSSTAASVRNSVLCGLYDGSIGAVFGTQSVIGENVKYKCLSLAVIDEQHRFGVKERAKLEDKGAVDVLTLTATPIPRTLALTVYDGIAVSRIEKRAEATTNISTKIMSDAKLPAMLSYLKTECENGKQAFIVCPSIKDNEGLEIYSIEQFIRDYMSIFSNLSTSILTGKMKPEEKNEGMRRFTDGETSLMLATSVIEVGIDTKASLIAILNADRFGLASLHQLRGRIGRDGSESYCFLHTKNPTDKALERLTALENISDGNLLAEKDLEMRGAGELLGARQSGASSTPFLKLPFTGAILRQAQIIASHPEDTDQFKALLGADYSNFAEELQSVTLNS